jgi:hypothetical protein
MGREVARSVRYRRRPAPFTETRERPEQGARRCRVRVVDGDREPPLHRGDHRRPRLVPGQADLGPQPLLGRQRPPPVQPLGFRAGDRFPETLAAVPPYEHPSWDARRVRLGDLHGYVVQPFVGEQQPGDVLRGPGQPLDPVIEGLGAVGDLDGVRARAGGHVGGQGREDAGGQLAPPRGHVDEVETRGPPQRLVDAAQQPGHGPGEQRRGVHGRTEVPGRALRPAVEAVRTVEGGLGGGPPSAPVARRPGRRVIGHAVRLGARGKGASTLGSTRGRYGSVLRLTPAHTTLPYAGLRAAPL